MRIIPVLLITYFVTVACGSNKAPTLMQNDYPISVYVIGDSLCNLTYRGSETPIDSAWPEMLSISHDCVSGRAPYWDFNVPSGYDLTIIALGTNGAFLHTDYLRVAYQDILDRVDGDVLCVLTIYEPENQVIKSLCANTVEPPAPDNQDGLHYEYPAQQLHAELIHNWIIGS